MGGAPLGHLDEITAIKTLEKAYDSGKIIMQKKIKILKRDCLKSLKKKVLRIEHEIYPKAIKKILINP